MKNSILSGSLRALCLVVPILPGGCHSGSAPSEESASRAIVHAQKAKKVVLGEWTDLFGTTQPLPNYSARISAVVEGRVLSVLGDGKGSSVVEGEQVTPGQVIVQLDDSVPLANRDKLKATVNDLEE